MLLFCCSCLPTTIIIVQQQWHYRNGLYRKCSKYKKIVLPLHLAFIATPLQKEGAGKKFFVARGRNFIFYFLTPSVVAFLWYARWVNMPSVKEKLLIIIAIFSLFDTLAVLLCHYCSIRGIYCNLLFLFHFATLLAEMRAVVIKIN